MVKLGAIALALFAVSGQIKETVLFRWMPFDLTMLTAVICLLSFLWQLLQDPPPLRNWAGILTLWTLFLTPVTLHPSYAYGETKILVLFTLSLFAISSGSVLLRTNKQLTWFLATLVVVSALAAITLILWPASAEYHTTSFLEGSNTIGTSRLLNAGALILLVYALLGKTRSPIGRAAILAVAMIMIALAISTGSRGPLLSLILALILTILIVIRIGARGAVGVAILLMAMLPLATPLLSRFTLGGAARLTGLLGGRIDTSAEARFFLWDRALDIVATKPLGIGWGNFSLEPELAGFAALTDGRVYPHNILLEVGVEAGWIPLIGLVAFGASRLTRLFNSAQSQTTVAVLALAIFATANAMVSGDVNDNRLGWTALGSAPCLGLYRPCRDSSSFLSHNGGKVTANIRENGERTDG